jgi:hypothetical protein
MNENLIDAGFESLTAAELIDITGGDVFSLASSFAHDVGGAVGVAVAFYKGIAEGFFG